MKKQFRDRKMVSHSGEPNAVDTLAEYGLLTGIISPDLQKEVDDIDSEYLHLV